MDQRRYLLTEDAIPRQWYNVAADLPSLPPPPAAPRDRRPGGPRRPAAALPDGADPAGGLGRSLDRRSPTRCARSTRCGGPRRSTAPWAWSRRSAPPAASSTSTRASARPGSHKPNTSVPQAYYNRRRACSRLATETGAGQWGSALAFACAVLRPRVQGLHGAGLVRPEAVPALDDPAPGAARSCRAPRRTPRRPGDPRGRRPTAPAASASRSARRSRTRPRATTPSTRSAACSTTSCCTRRSSARRPGAARAGRAPSRT